MNDRSYMTERERVRLESRAQEREVKARRSTAKCLSCGRKLLENTSSTDVPVSTVELDGTVGLTQRSVTTLDRDFGYRGTGICTLRCGFNWAHKRLNAGER